MSNDILGAAVSNDPKEDTEGLLRALSAKTPLGFFVVKVDEVEATLGRFFSGVNRENVVNFRITDRPEARNATYLVDGIDYAEGNTIGLPARSTERLGLLVRLVKSIFAETGVDEVYLALMDSSQLDEMRAVSVDDFSSAMLADMERFSPPDTVYRIQRTLR